MLTTDLVLFGFESEVKIYVHVGYVVLSQFTPGLFIMPV